LVWKGSLELVWGYLIYLLFYIEKVFQFYPLLVKVEQN